MELTVCLYTSSATKCKKLGLSTNIGSCLDAVSKWESRF